MLYTVSILPVIIYYHYILLRFVILNASCYLLLLYTNIYLLILSMFTSRAGGHFRPPQPVHRRRFYNRMCIYPYPYLYLYLYLYLSLCLYLCLYLSISISLSEHIHIYIYMYIYIYKQ